MSFLRGIDISDWQRGIDLSAVPADFVIVKATEGTGYVSKDWERQATQTTDTHKRLGLYHYANGGDVVSEADYFLRIIQKYIGKAILVLDWESCDNPAFGSNDYNWCNHWCSYVEEKTGVKPILYLSQSILPRFTQKNFKYEYWVAQYANNSQTGYQDFPWNEGSYPCLIRQYSSAGWLPGYDGFLDLDKFYGSAADWDSRIEKKPTTDKTDSTIPPYESTFDLSLNTMRGKYGDGENRKKALGIRYNEVQNFINHIYSSPVDTLVNETKSGKYGNGDARKTLLGSRYNEVQNQIDAEANQSSPVYYQIQSGDTLSGIAAKYKTTWQKLAKMNGITNPNYIMAGQKIRVK